VKIRGTPAHIAEKYTSLARVACSSGDSVLAENYLQHAEHYNRNIIAYREQQMQQSVETPQSRRDHKHHGLKSTRAC
jgi:phage shock protein A